MSLLTPRQVILFVFIRLHSKPHKYCTFLQIRSILTVLVGMQHAVLPKNVDGFFTSRRVLVGTDLR